MSNNNSNNNSHLIKNKVQYDSHIGVDNSDDAINNEIKLALTMLKDHNNQLKTNQEYIKLDIEDRLKLFQNTEQYIDFFKLNELNTEDRIKILSNIEKYRDFTRKFPIVTRYLIQLGMFSSKAFKKYLKHLNNIRPTPEERDECKESHEKQCLWFNKHKAYYIKWLWEDKQKSKNQIELNKIYRESLEELNKDTRTFFKLIEIEKEKLKNKKNQNLNELKNELKNIVKLKFNN